MEAAPPATIEGQGASAVVTALLDEGASQRPGELALRQAEGALGALGRVAGRIACGERQFHHEARPGVLRDVRLGLACFFPGSGLAQTDRQFRRIELEDAGVGEANALVLVVGEVDVGGHAADAIVVGDLPLRRQHAGRVARRHLGDLHLRSSIGDQRNAPAGKFPPAVRHLHDGRPLELHIRLEHAVARLDLGLEAGKLRGVGRVEEFVEG